MGNQISIRHSVPITVLDLAHITGTITVRFADGTERFHRVGTDNRVR